MDLFDRICHNQEEHIKQLYNNGLQHEMQFCEYTTIIEHIEKSWQKIRLKHN